MRLMKNVNYSKSGLVSNVALAFALLGLGLTFAGSAANAQEAGAQAAAPDPTSASETEQLARDVERAQSLRDIKNLQYSYAQYAQYGMIDDIVSLFSANASIRMTETGKTIEGRDAIRAYFIDLIGTEDGLAPEQLFNHMFYDPVVTLAYDGGSAQARWTDLGMRGKVGAAADWFGGMQVNDYIREGGVWKIARLNIYSQLAGAYEKGFFATAKTLPLVPYHFSAAQAGRPVPAEAGDADRAPRGLTLLQIAAKTQAMNDEDAVRNLQHIYGYYADMKMWDDVADLFAPDGVMEIAGAGIYDGQKSVRRGLERDGPTGLKYGQIHDQIQLHTIVEVSPNGREARARGMQLGMLTPKLGEAYWGAATFVNSFVKIDGKWRIREMRIFPRMKADYYQGWHKSVVIDPVPGGAAKPDRRSSSASPQTARVVPVFPDNPVTGKPVHYPAGFTVVGDKSLLRKAAVAGGGASGPADSADIAEARRRLNVSKGWDAVENISSAFAYYLDDWQWDEFTQNMAIDGTRPQGRGFYVGRDKLYRAMTESHLAPTSLSNPRDGIRVHLRLQPVIDVSPDGSAAKIRTRMFLYYANQTQAGAWNSGMYPNDTAVLEDGVWKMKVGGVIDETYFRSTSYADGWAKFEVGADGKRVGRRRMPATEGGASRNGNPISFAPDIPWTSFQSFRRKDFDTTDFPFQKPMWFHYRNPITGRLPEHYCPDILTCKAP